MLDIILRLVNVRVDEDGQIVRANDDEEEVCVLVDEWGYIRTQPMLDVDHILLTEGCTTLGYARIAEYNRTVRADRQKDETYAPRENKKKARLYEEVGYKCAYCGCDLDVSGFHIEHIIPRVRGGSSEENNLTASCPSCNSLKKNMTSDEFAFYILREVRNGNKTLRDKYEACLVEADGVTAFGFSQQDLIDKKLGA